MKTRIPTALLLSSALLFAGVSCATVAKGDTIATPDKAKKAAEDEKKDPEDKQQELEDKQRELRIAKLELQIKQTSTLQSMQVAEEKAEAAAVEVEQAQKALTLFRETEKPHRLREIELRIQKSQYRIENLEQDLQQMVADYEGNDEFYAQKTGEIVVWRSRKDLEFARADLELLVQSRDKLVAHTLVEEEQELMRKLALSKSAHERATQLVANAGLEAEAELIRAEAKIEKLDREIEKAKEELEA